MLFAPHAQKGPQLGHSQRDLEECKGKEIYVRLFTGKILTIAAADTDTVLTIKNKVEAEEGIPTTQQMLLYDGILYEDRQKIGDAGIHHGATVNIISTMKSLEPKPDLDHQVNPGRKNAHEVRQDFEELYKLMDEKLKYADLLPLGPGGEKTMFFCKQNSSSRIGHQPKEKGYEYFAYQRDSGNKDPNYKHTYAGVKISPTLLSEADNDNALQNEVRAALLRAFELSFTPYSSQPDGSCVKYVYKIDDPRMSDSYPGYVFVFQSILKASQQKEVADGEDSSLPILHSEDQWQEISTLPLVPRTELPRMSRVSLCAVGDENKGSIRDPEAIHKTRFLLMLEPRTKPEEAAK